MDFSFSDFIGTFGVTIIVITYFLLQLEKIDPRSLSYSLINALGSMMILYSLMSNWNLASVIIEVFWISISLFGVWKYFKRKSL